jgi:hypothetical protein
MKITTIKIFQIIICCSLIISCDSVEQQPNTLEGMYKGTYSITQTNDTDSSFTFQGTVTFQFTKYSYQCVGEKTLLPPRGAGRYLIDS